MNLQLLFLQACSSHQKNDLKTAERAYAKLFTSRYKNPFLYINYGALLRNKSELNKSLIVYNIGLSIYPDDTDILSNIACVYCDLEDFNSVIKFAQKALALEPKHQMALNNLVCGLIAVQDYGSALEYAIKCVQLYPSDFKAASNILISLSLMGRIEDAGAWFDKMSAINSPDIYFAKLVFLDASGNTNRLFELLESFKDWKKDKRVARIVCASYLKRSMYLECLQITDECLLYAPNDFDILSTKATALLNLNRLAEAYEISHQVNRNIRNPKTINLNGRILLAMGKPIEAVAEFRNALEIKRDPVVFDNILFAMQYSDNWSCREVAEAHIEYGNMFENRDTFLVHKNKIDSKKIIVGFIGGDFCAHPVSYFIIPLLEHYSKSRFSFYCYHTSNRRDNVTEKIISMVDAFVEMSTLADEQLVSQILNDGIHILVDLSGHTGHNKLIALSKKPAPIQVTWLGHPNTSGLTAIDWKLTDKFCDPMEGEVLCSEKLYRLPDIFCVYRPLITSPEKHESAEYAVQNPPCTANGYITFGSCNNYAKLTDSTVRLWSKVLEAVDGSKLFLEIQGLGEYVDQNSVRDRFRLYGVSDERLVLQKRDSRNQYIIYNKIDIALDPFPANGGTTTFDLLWMGVPLITLKGECFISRMGYSILSNLGRHEWVANDEEDYIRLAANLASDQNRLKEWRMVQRDKMKESPLMNEQLFSRSLERAFVEMVDMYNMSQK